MNRDDAVRKVGALMRLHADERGNEAERANALRQATALRLKFGISDHALELELAAAELDEETEFFGHKLFFYSRNIAPHVDAIRAEIAGALAKADQLDPLNRAETYCRLYRDLRDIVEGATWASHSTALKTKRDAAVKAYYQQVAYEYAASHDSSSGFYFERMQHEWARDRTASVCDLRKDAVERIVGITEKSMWLKEARANVCSACGLDGNEKRQVCELYDGDDGDGTGRVWMHPACKEKEASDVNS